MEYLEKNYLLIQKECLDVMKHYDPKNQCKKREKMWNKHGHNELSGWVVGPEAKGNEWLNYGLIYNDIVMEKNCKVCPKTIQLLNESGLSIKIAGFSWLRPHSFIPSHIDHNQEQVYHLGLVVKEGKSCYIRNKGNMYYHQEGKSMTFDDGQIHSAHNESDAERIVLYLLIR